MILNLSVPVFLYLSSSRCDALGGLHNHDRHFPAIVLPFCHKIYNKSYFLSFSVWRAACPSVTAPRSARVSQGCVRGTFCAATLSRTTASRSYNIIYSVLGTSRKRKMFWMIFYQKAHFGILFLFLY